MAILLMIFGFLRNSWVGKAVIFAGSALMFLLFVYFAGGRAQNKKQKIKNLEEYIDVRERADKVADETVQDLGSISRDDVHDRLRDHGAFRD